MHYVITKVNSKFFYINKHRNIKQFLLENCLKGICDCIIFERGYYPQDEINLISEILSEVNENIKIVSVKGKSLDYNDLSRVLSSK